MLVVQLALLLPPKNESCLGSLPQPPVALPIAFDVDTAMLPRSMTVPAVVLPPTGPRRPVKIVHAASRAASRSHRGPRRSPEIWAVVEACHSLRLPPCCRITFIERALVTQTNPVMLSLAVLFTVSAVRNSVMTLHSQLESRVFK